MFSVGTGLIISFTLGALIGMVQAYKRGSLFDTIASTFASITGSVPNYQLALLIIVLFAPQGIAGLLSRRRNA